MILLHALGIYLYANGRLIYLIGGIILVAFSLYTAFSITKIFVLLAFYVSAFPMLEYIGNFPGLPFGFAWYVAYPLFVLLATYWLVYVVKTQEHFLGNDMDIAVLVYLTVMLLAAVHGLLKNHDLKILLWDFMPTTFFVGYFIFVYSPLKTKIRTFYDLLLISTLFVSIQFIYALARYRSLFMLTRVVSEHIHIAQFAIPYLITTLIYSKSRKRKILFAFLLPIVILAVIVCQQRALYASMLLTTIFLAGVLLHSQRHWIRNNAGKFVMYIASGLILIAIVGVVLQISTSGKFFITLYARLFVFVNLNRLSADTSWKIRWGEIRSAMRGLEHFWVLGKGFGISQITRFRYVRQIAVDNSYVYYIWKTGILGLLSCLYVYFLLFKRGFSTLKQKITADERIFVTTALLNAAGMMLVAYSNASIGNYRLMLVWAALFACTEIIARRYDKK